MKVGLILNCKAHPEARLLSLKLSGRVNPQAVALFGQSLQQAASELGAGGVFVLVDYRGIYFTEDASPSLLEPILPTFLAARGFHSGLAGMQKSPASPSLEEEQQVLAVAWVHHELGQVERFQQDFGSNSEQFFSDIEKAKSWILTRLQARPR